MTNQADRTAPAGWYPDPGGAPSLRWWDGGRWTERLAPAAAPLGEPATPARVPDGAAVDTVWIWLVVFLPIALAVPIVFGDYRAADVLDPSWPSTRAGT